MPTPAVNETPSPAPDNRVASDFTLGWVLDVLVRKKLLAPQQALDVKAKEGAARARVTKAAGVERYEVSPVEIVAAFQIPIAAQPGQTLDQDRVTEAVAEAAGIPYRKIDQLRLDMQVAARISKPYAQKKAILPLESKPQTGMVVAVANPFDRMLFEDLQRQSGGKVTPVLSAKADILKGIADVYGFKRTLAAAADDFSAEQAGVSNFEQLITLSTGKELDAQDKPVIQAVDYVLRYAFENRASDIHLEPKRDKSLVRFRIDGVLHTVYTLPAQVHAPITSRVKMISRIDISEKRKPQDGRIKVDREGREVEIRVSTLPTAFGEKTVMRIFDPETLVPDIAMLGFEIFSANEKAGAIWDRLAAPKAEGVLPAGLGARNTLRLEAGNALYGNDIDTTTTPLEANLKWAVAFDKEGGFVGRDMLLKQREDGMRRKLVGFKVLDKAPAREHYPIFKDGKRIGSVTSGSFGPTAGCNIGLGYVDRGHEAVGNVVQIEVHGRKVSAEIVKLPFIALNHKKG